MKAWKLHKIGGLAYEDVEEPQIGEDEVLVKVDAVGICGSDIPRIYRDGAHRMPLICGHEFSGEVVRCGEKADISMQNKRVGIFPLLPCKKCAACAEKRYEMCMDYRYLGSRCDGGFAEYVAVPSWNLIELPDGVTAEQAAMLEPMSVAVHAMRRTDPARDSVILIHGMGTIGQFLLMFLLERGFQNVYAVGNKALQKEVAVSLGLSAEHFCNAASESLEEFLLCKGLSQRVNVIFECVGRNEVLNQALELIQFGGKICLVGNPSSDMSFPKELYWKILRKQLVLVGTWNSTFYGEQDSGAADDDWHYVTARLQEKRILPEKIITKKYSLEDLAKGTELMRDKTEEYVKVMIRIRAES